MVAQNQVPAALLPSFLIPAFHLSWVEQLRVRQEHLVICWNLDPEGQAGSQLKPGVQWWGAFREYQDTFPPGALDLQSAV